MAINIFEVQPSVITRDLSGKSFYVFGEPKTGGLCLPLYKKTYINVLQY